MGKMKYTLINENFPLDSKSHTSLSKKLQNWPILYILTEVHNSKKNEKRKAYIGQTTSGYTRMAQHEANLQKKCFDNVNFIYSNEFNQSVTFDYESKLIQLFSADEKFELTNGNDGLADKDYYDKSYYDKSFEILWEKLKEKNIVNHSLVELYNSELFKYSPYKALTTEQHEIVDNIVLAIKENQHQGIIVNGIPGSGKTIIAIYLFKYLRDMGVLDESTSKTSNITNIEDKSELKIGLVIPQVSLRKTLKTLFKNIYGLKATDVLGPSEVVKRGKNYYDVLLVDEAHRLRKRKNITNFKSHDTNNKILELDSNGTELDWILRCCRCPILFYDARQLVGPSGIDISSLEEKTNAMFKSNLKIFNLNQQMRSKGGVAYIEYVQRILEGQQEGKEEFLNYDIKIVDDFKTFNNLLKEKEKNFGLTRMIAGYAWKWKSKKDLTAFDIEIENIKKKWNSTYENWVYSENSINEVGCIHTIQGYDLNYGFVILGNDIIFDKKTGRIKSKGENYYDNKGKNTATQDELDQYIKNIYYVLLTRGIHGTYIYVCNPDLRAYLTQFFSLYQK